MSSSYSTNPNMALPTTSSIKVPQKRKASTTAAAKAKSKTKSKSPTSPDVSDLPSPHSYSPGPDAQSIPSMSAMSSTFPTSQVVWSAYLPQPSSEPQIPPLSTTSFAPHPNYNPNAAYDPTVENRSGLAEPKLLIGGTKRNEQNRKAQSGYRKRRDE